ncbi:MAG: hypothetical protein E7645_05835 [Ruminococcaceae bacterium]|nr:hypothetical protein [Oscillospiraceae bacterium]
MDIMKTAALSLIGAVALLIFKQYKPEWSIPVRLALGVVFGGIILSGVGEIIAFASSLVGGNHVTSGLWLTILKALGIAFVTEIAAGICQDSGEGTMAMWVETAGKTALLLLSLPLVKEMLSGINSLLNLP